MPIAGEVIGWGYRKIHEGKLTKGKKNFKP
jgi:hypothetical protein